NNKFKYAAVNCNIDDTIVFKFKGKHLAMMNLLSRDGGRLVCQLDEEYGFYIDLFMDSDGYFNTTINVNNLENTDHTLTMVIDKDRNPKSLGNKVVIGGFLIDPGNKI
ncbi:SGNH/GDSL hydrolase family protein, partial [Clostridium neonatale]